MDAVETEATNNQESTTVDVSGLAPNSSDDVIIQEPPQIVINDPLQQLVNEPHDPTSTGDTTQAQDVALNSVHEETFINHRLNALKVPTFDGN